MSEKKQSLYKYLLIALTVIVLDQVVKMLVYFFMEKGPSGEIEIFGDFFKLHYLTNRGMAFGLEFSWLPNSKLVLTLLRLFAVGGIIYYISWLIKKQSPVGLLWCMALILGGAIGNVVDSTFYGLLLEGNLPHDAPYAWFHGQVIDMFYIDIWEGCLDIPLIGSKCMALWPVFNVADASIFIGISIILVFQRKYFISEEEE
ncbi:MAG: signal peptidase II, partial [Bacteroidota bacterium]